MPLVERRAHIGIARWTANGRPIPIYEDSLILIGRDPHNVIADAPVVFAGHGAVIPERGINQLAGADFHGAVALILYDGPAIEGFPNFAARRQAVTEAGAVAVIGIMGPDAHTDGIRAGARLSLVALAEPASPAVTGAIFWNDAVLLVRGAGRDLAAMLDEQPGSSFRSVPLRIRASLDVHTDVRTFISNNIIGRIPGSGHLSESVLLLTNWDDLGLVRSVDGVEHTRPSAGVYASGVASLVEVAGRVALGPRQSRDVLVVATTASWRGLLGAEWFATHLPSCARSIVAALNINVTAIAPAGSPVAVVGGTPAMEQLIGRVAVDTGRRLDMDRDADVLANQQDGYALNRHGIPAAMTGSNFSDMGLLFAVRAGLRPIDYSGAAEDANLLVALARAFADPAQYRPSPPPAAAPGASAGE